MSCAHLDSALCLCKGSLADVVDDGFIIGFFILDHNDFSSDNGVITSDEQVLID